MQNDDDGVYPTAEWRIANAGLAPLRLALFGQLPERPGGRGALSCDRSEERLQAAAQSLRFGHELTFLVSGMFEWGSGTSAVSSPDSALRSSSWATER